MITFSGLYVPYIIKVQKNRETLKLFTPGPEVKKLFSRSTQLSMKFQLLLKIKIPTTEEVSCFKPLRSCIYHANKR